MKLDGGPGGIRTPYLLTASQTFSQLNYGPSGSLIIYHKYGLSGKVGLLPVKIIRFIYTVTLFVYALFTLLKLLYKWLFKLFPSLITAQ
jgi:hypothetical protein